ncbi:MAG: O-antigen ligase family protein [Dehalobacterium sp.]
MIEKKIYTKNNRIMNIVVFLSLLSIQSMSLDTLSFISVPFIFSLVGLLLLNMLIKRENIPLINGHLWLIISFSILFISALISVNMATSLQYVAYYILYGLVFILLSFNSNWFNICLKTQLVFSLIHAVVTIFSSIFPSVYYALVLPFYSNTNKSLIVYWMQNGNYPGIAGQIGTNSFFISLGIAIIIAYVLTEPTKKRGVYIVLLTMLTYALFLTGKRGMLIGNMIAILVTWYLGPLSCNKTRIFKVIKALVTMLTGLYLLSGVIPVLEQTMGRFLNNWGDADFSSGRIELFKEAWQLFGQKYVFGYGINTYTTLSIEGFNNSVGAHNDLLQFLAEVGFIGTVFYIAPIVWIFMKTIRILRSIYKNSVEKHNKYRLYLIVSLYVQVLILFYSIIGNPFHYYNILFLYMIFSAIPISMDLEIRREKRRELLK